MIMMIMAAAELFAFALSSLFITQTVAAAIADMEVNRWVLMAVINVFLFICGMFLPPVAVIVMTSPMLFPIVTQAGFDPYSVRDRADDQHGGRPDHASDRPQPFCDQCHRAADSDRRHILLGLTALRAR